MNEASAAGRRPLVLVVGAGLVGSYVGALLAAGGLNVCFLVRRGRAAGRPAGLTATPLGEPARSAPPERIGYTEDPAAAALADLVLVCVKGPATEAAAAPLAPFLAAGQPVVSLQNGVDNVARLRRSLPGAQVIGGLIGCNVVSPAPGDYRQATSGEVWIAKGGGGAAGLLRRGGLKVEEAADIEALQWGKLMINLNNALVALSDRTLAEELADSGWRRVLSGQMDEARAAVKAEGVTPRAPGPRFGLIRLMLKLPDWAYAPLAGRVVKVAPDARSSMWEDLAAGRPTEIDDLQGAVVRLAARHGLKAPLNARVAELVKAVEAGTRARPVTPSEVLSAYSAA